MSPVFTQTRLKDTIGLINWVVVHSNGGEMGGFGDPSLAPKPSLEGNVGEIKKYISSPLLTHTPPYVVGANAIRPYI